MESTDAFANLQDADSLDKAGKKSEGAYYVWTAQEIDEVLGPATERGQAFKRHYYVKANGNVDLSPRRYALRRALPEHGLGEWAPYAWAAAAAAHSCVYLQMSRPAVNILV